MRWKRGGLYPILDIEYCRERKIDILDLIETWSQFPDLVNCIQLRAKTITIPELEKIYTQLMEIKKFNIIINDYWEFALDVNAYGLHLGKEDFEELGWKEKNRIKFSKMIKGTSSHSLEDMELAEKEGIWDYTGLGPMFPTETKKTNRECLGFEVFQKALGRKLPVVPIGGISIENWKQVALNFDCRVASISLFADKEKFREIAVEYCEKLSLTMRNVK